MAYQQYANSVNPATTLSGNGGSITSGATSMKVASTANLPANPNFTLGISTSGVIEWVLVTAISSLTLTITRAQEGSTGASHNDGDSVYLVLTAGALQQILLEQNNYGAVASRPTSTTGARTGITYRTNDNGENWVFDGSVWRRAGTAYENIIDIPPATANAMDDEFDTGSTFGSLWTQRGVPGSGSPAITVQNHWVTFAVSSAPSSRMWGLAQPVPSGNWKVRCKYAFDGPTYNYTGAGMFVRKISGDKNSYAFQLFNSGACTMWQIHGSPITADNSETNLYDVFCMKGYIEIEYDGTNLTWRWSQTGVIFRRFWQEAAGAGGNYLDVMDEVGIMMHVQGDNNANNNPAVSFDWFRRIS